MTMLQPVDGRGHPVPVLPLYATAQNVSFTATSARTAAVVAADLPAAEDVVVTLVATTACRVLVASGSPTAVATSPYLPAGVMIDVLVKAGDKIAAIRDSADGTLIVMPRR